MSNNSYPSATANKTRHCLKWEGVVTKLMGIAMPEMQYRSSVYKGFDEKKWVWLISLLHFQYAETFSVNPHKWMLINFDCSVMWYVSILSWNVSTIILVRGTNKIRNENTKRLDKNAIWKRKKEKTQSYDKSPFTNRNVTRVVTWQHTHVAKKFDYKAIADWLRRVR